MRILVVEDDEPIAALLQQGLEDAGYSVAVSGSGDEALKIASEQRFHVMVFDVMLPGMDGMALCQALRRRQDRTPVLMLTARGRVEDKIRGLDLGADDYLTKPFDFGEFLARVRSLARRNQTCKSSRIQIADLEVDATQYKAYRNGELLPLNHREFELLLALASNEGKVFTREMIIEQVWMSDPPTSNVVDVIVRSLRKKMDEGQSVRLIQTVWGFGYTLRGPDKGDRACDAR